MDPNETQIWAQKQPSEQPSFQHLTVTLKCNILFTKFKVKIRKTQQTDLKNVHKYIINILPISFLKLRGGGVKKSRGVLNK